LVIINFFNLFDFISNPYTAIFSTEGSLKQQHLQVNQSPRISPAQALIRYKLLLT